MSEYNTQYGRRNSAAQDAPLAHLHVVGAIALGDRSNLTVQVGVAGGARIVSLRNHATQGRGGMLPIGTAAIVGLDHLGDLITLLQQARAS